MEATEMQKRLIHCLASANISEPTRVIAFLQMDDDEQCLQMCEYLSEHKDAADPEIMAAAKRIAGE